MQQATDSHKYAPMYIDRLVLFFTPSGGIVVKIGNQHLIASAKEVSELIEGRLAQHQLFAELFNREPREGQS